MRVELEGKLVVELPENIHFWLERQDEVTHLKFDLKVGKEEEKKEIKVPTEVPVMPRVFQSDYQKLEKLNELYDSGIPAKRIADMLGIRYHNILRALKAEGKMTDNATRGKKDTVKLKPEKRTRPLMPTESEKAQIVQEYENGTSTRQLMEKYNTTRGHIHQILHDAEVELRDERKDGNPRNEKLKSAEKDAIDRLHREGKSLQEIVSTLGGVSIGQVTYYLRQNHMM